MGKEFLITSSGNEIRVYGRETIEYQDAIIHRFPNGISEVTRYVVVPRNETDLRLIMELLAERRIPFGLKSGGHISIPKFRPPNEGILISMRLFNNINYDEEKKTLDVGAGVIWRTVNEYLERFTSDHARGVVGGDPDVGVSGWLLGGGYSLLTDRFGLGIDNVVGFRVLVPGAKHARNVSREENPVLFRALKGGGHNFGIITQFTLQVHDHAKRTSPVKSREYFESESIEVKNRLLRFIQGERPPEEVVLASFRHDFKDGQLTSCIPLYEWRTDGFAVDVAPDPGPVLGADVCAAEDDVADLVPFFFSNLDGDAGQDSRLMSFCDACEAFCLRHLPVSLKTLQTPFHFKQLDLDTLWEIEGNMLDLKAGDLIKKTLLTSLNDGKKIDWNSLTIFRAGYKKVVMESSPDLRGRMASIMVSTFTPALIDEAENQAKILSLFMEEHQGIRVGFEIWPFHKNAFNGLKREDSAWPHEEGKVFGPVVGWFEWSGKDNDEFWLEQIANALKELRKVAPESEDLPMYPNITLESTSTEEIYRGDNIYQELKNLRYEYDPDNVMGLAAGFVIDV